MSSTSKNVDAVEPPSKMRKIDATGMFTIA